MYVPTGCFRFASEEHFDIDTDILSLNNIIINNNNNNNNDNNNNNNNNNSNEDSLILGDF